MGFSVNTSLLETGSFGNKNSVKSFNLASIRVFCKELKVISTMDIRSLLKELISDGKINNLIGEMVLSLKS